MEQLNNTVQELIRQGFPIRIEFFAEGNKGGFDGPAVAVHAAGIVKLEDGTEFPTIQGEILFNRKYRDTPMEQYNQHRLRVVLFHEVGHVIYHRNHPMTTEERNQPDEIINDEAHAIKNSLSESIALFDTGDRLPLKEALFWLTVRSYNTKDYHEAILKIKNDKIWEIAWKRFQ